MENKPIREEDGSTRKIEQLKTSLKTTTTMLKEEKTIEKIKKIKKNCEFEPIKLKDNNEDEWVAHTLPPDPLHTNLLGPVNDLMDKLEELWPIEVKDIFYKAHYLNKNGEGAGGKFNWLLIKTIIKNINDLEEILPEEAGDFIKYLESLRDLHKMCIEERLPSNFK